MNKHINYGTSGFRRHSQVILSIAHRIGCAVALLSCKHQKPMGIMVTASHNHHEDNGVKIMDENGNMIGKADEEFLEKYVNGCDNVCGCDDVCRCNDEWTKEEESLKEIHIGYDSRASSPIICDMLIAGIRSVHADFPFLVTPLITTPQMHYLLSNKRDTLYLDYVNRISRRVMYPCVVDCANGIGAKVMQELEPNSSIILINDSWKTPTLLNVDCSSDYVCTHTKMPINSEPTDFLLRASLDGDADRLIFYYTEKGALRILNGDYVSALIMTYLSKILIDTKETIRIGFIHTGYTNGACIDYIHSLEFPHNVQVTNVCTATGIKHLHAEAIKYDVGVYFEQNGHGNVHFSSSNPILDTMSNLFHPNIGDGVIDLFASLYILQNLEWDVQDWYNMYTEKHSVLSKISVENKNVYKSNADETSLIEPKEVQDCINQLCKSGYRSFIRASGTEDIVRLFVEGDDVDEVQYISDKITFFISNLGDFTRKGDEFIVRPLQNGDIGDSYYTLLGQLTKIDVKNMNESLSTSFVRSLHADHNIMVIEHANSNTIVATGTIFIEQKLLRNYGKVGHIEDIVVDDKYRGYGLGKEMIRILTDYSMKEGCYKCILDCSDENVRFYEKCGYERKGAQMSLYN